jgi:malate dehydrogenase (oxaloacetate-decarboxylating)(NADP+)
MSSIRKEDSLEYHRSGKKGKIEITPTKPVSTVRDLSLAYSPGVAYPCLEIHRDPQMVYEYTAKGNLVAVITNGTAVLGLGNIGPEAAKPVMEGKSVLFKKFADIDSIDIEVRAESAEEFINVVKALEPTFGGINLEDIKAPECFEIEEKLREALNIPVMHDDQHGTAIISSAALLSALTIVQKPIESVQMVISGAGAAAIACAKLYIELGLRVENILMFDVNGLLSTARTDLDEKRSFFATKRTDVKDFRSAFKGADVFVGLSAGGIVDEDMVKSMAENPIVFALANPTPEIDYDKAKLARPDAIVATGRSDYPNQVNNVLGFPYIFRGALDVRATEINEAMKLGAVRAIAELAKESVPDEINQIYGQVLKFGPEYLIPKPMDYRLMISVSVAVAQAAIESGVARIQITDWEKYKNELLTRVGLNKRLMNAVISRSKLNPKRIVLPEGENIKIIKAARMLVDDGIAIPVLLGNPKKIAAIAEEFGEDLPSVQIIDPEQEEGMRETYAQLFHDMRKRKGMTLVEARSFLQNHNYFGTFMVEHGDVDGMITGLTENYSYAIRPALEIIGLEDGTSTTAGLYILNSKRGIFLFADCTMNRDPDENRLVDIAMLTARAARFLNIEPRVAMLSYSNFGSNRDPLTEKVARATAKLKAKMPDLIVDGEIQANIALRPDLMQEFFPFNALAEKGANTFIFPGLASANIAYKFLQEIGEVEAIGPVLMGLKKPVHVLQMGCSVREIVNMVAVCVVDAQSSNEFF